MYYYSQGQSTEVSVISRYSVLRNLAIACMFLAPIAACGGNLDSEQLINPASTTDHTQKAAIEKQRLSIAEKYFNEGKYGSAEQAYRLAIEINPRNVEAWLGIAATYDNLKKFPNANRAYMIAIKLKGYTPDILNNLGYHYILRGEFSKARKALTAAAKKQPDNHFIQNNLKLLEQYESKSK